MANLTHPRVAFETIISQIAPINDIEEIDLFASLGRVLAQDYSPEYSSPAQNMSAMDGYAVIYQENCQKFKIIGESRAGKDFGADINHGQAVRIFTGAILPQSANAIIIQENAEIIGDDLICNHALIPWQYIRKKGMDFEANQAKIAQKTQITPRIMGILASFGYSKIRVFRSPRVLLITSGDELIMPTRKPQAQQTIASNFYLLHGLLSQMGAQVEILPILPDNLTAISNAIAANLSFDCIITSGGASVGDYDFILPSLQALKATINLAKLALRPGKPMIFAKIAQTPIICLPGNVVSNFICGYIYLKPILAIFNHQPAQYIEDIASDAILGADIAPNDQRLEFMRANYANGIATPIKSQDSSLQFHLSQASCLIIRPIHSPIMKKGDKIQIIPLTNL